MCLCLCVFTVCWILTVCDTTLCFIAMVQQFSEYPLYSCYYSCYCITALRKDEKFGFHQTELRMNSIQFIGQILLIFYHFTSLPFSNRRIKLCLSCSGLKYFFSQNRCIYRTHLVSNTDEQLEQKSTCAL